MEKSHFMCTLQPLHPLSSVKEAETEANCYFIGSTVFA